MVGAGDFQGVETPMSVINAQKGGHKKKTTTTRRHKETGMNRSGKGGFMMEEDMTLGLETRPLLGPERTGPLVKDGSGGGVVRGISEKGRNQEGRNHSC